MIYRSFPLTHQDNHPGSQSLMMVIHPSCHHRRGAILLIVLTLLALFAVVGLVFVNYSQSQATSAQVRRSAVSTTEPMTFDRGGLASAGYPETPVTVVNDVLRKLLYPVQATGNDTTIAVRGYDMATMVYGNRPGDLNAVAYNGHGTFHEDITAAGVAGLSDRAEVINYSYRPGQPLFDPEHTGYRSDPNTAPTGTFIGRNAPYTYPDRNNAYVAVIDPATGLIVEPSFHRSTLFGNFGTVSGGTANYSSNANWNNPSGRYKILRPRSGPGSENPNFPFPPPNPDGTITGDVQNLRYADGRQRNDSVWLDFGIAPTQFQGKTVKALVAPLILPLDGSINLNAAGNLANGGGHGSNQGFGPWEIDLGFLLGNPADASQLLQRRYGSGATPSPRGSNLANAYFHPDPNAFNGQQLPATPVDWDGAGPDALMSLPGDAGFPPDRPFAMSPFWPNATTTMPAAGPYDTAAIGVDMMSGHPIPAGDESLRHPSLYSPYEWDVARDSSTGPVAFPFLDLRQFRGRYSDLARNYSQPYLGRQFPNSLGETAGSSIGNPANLRRALVTTISNSLVRPGLAPNLYGQPGLSFRMDVAAGETVPRLTRLPPFIPSAAAGSLANDLVTNAAGIRHLRAAFGSLNLNRPLADYRDNVTQPLSDTNIGNAANARRDRQELARDILVRLVVACGASVPIDPVTGNLNFDPMAGAPAPGTPEYDAVRWLAQLAANIVDYIDEDDISTAFVWNPVDPSDPYDAAANFADEATIRQRVVFGVEQPRLLINEVYAELANHIDDWQADTASKLLQVRFFIELLNPGMANPNTAAAQDSVVPLKGYKVQVVNNANVVETALFTNMGDPTIPARNVTGSIDETSPALKLNCTLDDLKDPSGNPISTLEPNNGQFAADLMGGTRNGFLVIGPPPSPMPEKTPTAFAPDTTGSVFAFMGIKTAPNDTDPNQLQYRYGTNAPADIPVGRTMGGEDGVQPVLATINGNNHAILLRRLANPYLPGGLDNPYITVDVFTQVRVNDAVRVGKDDLGTNMFDESPRQNPPMINTNRSAGRVAPLAGTGTLTDPFPDTFVLPQTNGGHPTAQQHSFFKHNSIQAFASPPMPPTTPNGTETLLTPFRWLTHLDRRLVNPLELLQVSAVKPYELTRRFMQPVADTPFHKHDLATAIELGTTPTMASPLYRALELLGVKPWSHGVPMGGRMPGRVNINMIWHRDVFNAILNPNGRNHFTPAEVNAIWQTLVNSRSPEWNNSRKLKTTFDEINPATIDPNDPSTWPDRPFKSFGAAIFDRGGGRYSGLQDTLLRSANPYDPASPPAFLLPPDANRGHPYQQWEALRKAINNLTTTSDTYLVLLTISWFEVTNPGPYSLTNPPQLGTEVYREIPGDLRVQYVAVLDRTQLGVDQSNHQVKRVWFRDLVDNVPAGSAQIRFPASPGSAANEARIYCEGESFDIKPGTVLRLGTGDAASGLGDGEWVTVASVVYDTNSGLATVNLTVATSRTHPAGSAVSNAFLKNPGRPEDVGDTFDFKNPKFQGVVPFVAELQPTQ